MRKTKVKKEPALLGRFLHLPSPWSLMYSLRILSSWTVQAPLFKPSFEQQGLLPISLLMPSVLAVWILIQQLFYYYVLGAIWILLLSKKVSEKITRHSRCICAFHLTSPHRRDQSYNFGPNDSSKSLIASV